MRNKFNSNQFQHYQTYVHEYRLINNFSSYQYLFTLNSSKWNSLSFLGSNHREERDISWAIIRGQYDTPVRHNEGDPSQDLTNVFLVLDKVL